MLKSYEAIYEHGQITWLAEQPQVSSARIIVTVLPENAAVISVKRRIPPAALPGKGNLDRFPSCWLRNCFRRFSYANFDS